MPDPEDGCEGLSDIFNEHIFSESGVPWTMVAAIMGAHSIGSAKPEFSGYDGFWSDAKNSGIFNNQYYHSVLAKGWAPELAVGGRSDKNQWKRVDVGVDPNHKEFMLTTDICLAFGNSPKYVTCMVESNATKKAPHCSEVALGPEHSTLIDPHFAQCCTWVNGKTLAEYGGYFDNGPQEYCGHVLDSMEWSGKAQRNKCCGGMEGYDEVWGVDRMYFDCDSNLKPQGPAAKSMVRYAGDEELWLEDFHRAWKFATENNQPSLLNLVLKPVNDNPPFDCGKILCKWECRENHQCEWEDENGETPRGFAQEDGADIVAEFEAA